MGANYKHLSFEERTMNRLSLEQRVPILISRELNCNGWIAVALRT